MITELANIKNTGYWKSLESSSGCHPEDHEFKSRISRHKIKGEVLHPRSVVAKYNTTKMNQLKKIDPEYERIEMLKKHRYIYILHKRDKKFILKSLKHPLKSYTKNNDNCSW